MFGDQYEECLEDAFDDVYDGDDGEIYDYNIEDYPYQQACWSLLEEDDFYFDDEEGDFCFDDFDEPSGWIPEDDCQ